MAYVTPGDNLETRERTVFPPTAEERKELHEETVTEGVFAGGASVEAIGGITGVVLAVIGLATFWQYTMCGIACIAIGVALVAHGGAIVARWNEALVRLGRGRYDRAEVMGGIGTEIFGGAAGIVLGVLALANIAPYILLPVAAIVFGGTLLLGGAAQPELENLAPEYNPRIARITHQAIEASGGVMVMVGIAAAVLGILALLHVGSMVALSLVAMLCVGGALLIAGGSLAARFARRFT